MSKLSLGATAVVLASGTVLVSRQNSEISQLEEQVEVYSSELGPEPTARRRVKSSSRDSTLSLVSELKELEPTSKEGDASSLREMDAHFKIRVASLTASEAENVVRQLLASEDKLTKAELRVLRYALVSLADQNPAASVALIAEALESGLVEKASSLRFPATTALVNLGCEDFAAFQERFDALQEIPRLGMNNLLADIFTKRSAKDYGAALKLITEEIDGGLNQTWAIYGIHRSLSVERAGDLLAAIRESDVPASIKKQALEGFGVSNFWPDVATGAAWMEEQDLSYEEVQGVLAGLTRRGRGSEAEWMKWVADDSVKNDRFGGYHKTAFRNLLSSLAGNDLFKVGEVINTFPDGSAIQEYARALYVGHVGNVNPEAAIEWFETLSPGQSKIKTGRDLYHNLMEYDAKMADDFAKRNRLYVD